MPAESVTILGLGFILGLKHALDADHVIAIATIVSERKGILSSSLVGMLWGIGHTAALLVIGGCVVALQLQLPEKLALSMEFAVAVMLILLGGNVLKKVYRGETLHVHVHSHHGRRHVHLHAHAADSPHDLEEASHHDSRSSRLLKRALARFSENRRSLLIGMVHGMAGSAGLMLLVLATISDSLLALAYIGVFGIGSMGGMLVMSALVGLPFAFTANRSILINRIIRGCAGSVSVIFGLLLAWQIGVVEGLFIR
jgi:high-affinity nickel permease